MYKYAVDQDVDQEAFEKAASDGCPECGAKVIRSGNILRCPTHGTAPWEKSSDKEESK